MPPPCCAVSVSGTGSGESLHCRYLVENGGEGQGCLPLESQWHRGNSVYNIGDKMRFRVPGLELCTKATCIRNICIGKVLGRAPCRLSVRDLKAPQVPYLR